eukprot:1154318-Pelagomonas_calceolata.AAC.8
MQEERNTTLAPHWCGGSTVQGLCVGSNEQGSECAQPLKQMAVQSNQGQISAVALHKMAYNYKYPTKGTTAGLHNFVDTTLLCSITANVSPFP